MSLINKKFATKSDLRLQIQNLSHQIDQQSSRIVIHVGIILINVATIMTIILMLMK